MKAIVVDDDPSCISSLSEILTRYCPQVQLAGSATSVQEAVALINATLPNVVFLDIEIHNETGFDVFRFFPSPTFKVVFTTAHEKYALRAIKASCFDFLLKPVIIEEVVQVVSRLTKEQHQHEGEKVNVLMDHISTGSQQRKIAIPSADGYVFLDTDDIVCLEADGKYTKITSTSGALPLSTKNLGEFEELLDTTKFFRSHKSWIINISCVKKFLKNESQVMLTNNQLADVSSRKKDEFLKLFSKG